MISALIADDEPLARSKLRQYLQHVTWLEVIGETTDGPTTVARVDELQPDVLFLDVRLPGCSGLAVLEQIVHRPAIVFTTAYDRFAVAAFELQAVDYLLKPFGRDRLDAALARVRETLDAGGEGTSVERARAALANGENLQRLFVRERGKITPLAVRSVMRFEARDDYVVIHTPERRYLASVRMNELEEQLDPAEFLRIHRSHIVNLNFVTSFTSHDTGRLQVTLQDGTRLFVSRARSQDLRRRAV